MKNVIVIGTGSQAKVITNIIELTGDCVEGYLTCDNELTSFLGKPVLGDIQNYSLFPHCFFIIAIGDQCARERIAAEMAGARFYTAIHPSAIISRETVTIGEGTVVSAGAVINPYATVGRHCIINTTAVVEHDCVISDFTHLSVGAKLGGKVRVGRGTLIGVGAAIRDSISICDGCTVGVGAAVVKDITECGVYVGVPAEKTEK